MTEQPITTEQSTTSQQPAKSSWFDALVRDRTRAWILLAALCIPAGTIVILAIRGTDPTAVVGTVLPTAGIVPMDPGPLMALEAARQAAQTALRRYQYQLKDASDIHERLQEQIEAWQNEIEPCLKNERGQFLAAQPDLVRRFAAAYRAPRFKQADLEAAKSRVAELSRPFDDALGGRGALFNPDDDDKKTLAAQIQQEQQLAQNALSNLRQARNAASAILEQAKTLGNKATYTLAEAMDKEDRGFALDMAQKTASLQEQAQREAAELEAQALAEQTRKLAKQRVAQIEADTAAKAEELKKQLSLDAERAERKRLQEMAKDPAIQAKFKPFLAKGYRDCASNPRWSVNEFPRPVSLNVLHNSGALNDAYEFARAGAGKVGMFTFNDRPRWGYPTREEDLKQFEPLLKQFKQLAPIWVEMGLLQP